MKDYNEKHHSEVVFGILNKFDYTALCISGTGDIIFANNAFLDAYDLAHEHVQGRKVYDSELHITDEERWHEIIEKTKAEGGKYKYERKRVINGQVHYSDVTIIDYDTPDEERILFFSQDITEKKISQMEVNALNRMLKKIIDNLPVYLFVKDVDDDLRYLIWNQAFANYAKIPAEKVIGRTDFEVFPDFKDAQQFRDDDLRVIETGEMAQKTESYMAADGTVRMCQTYKTLVEREGRGPLLVGISLDITDLEGIEEQLVRERLRAEESDRLKTRFLANMSHEIRTPLNAIVGFASLLSDAEDEDTRQEFLGIINENTEQLLRLINDILDLSKIEAGTLEYTRMPMDLYDTMRNIQMTYANRMHNNVKLIFDNENAPCKFIINEDRNRLTQVIDNLLNNAIKFTEQGEIHYGFVVNNNNWIDVYVSDTGRGIPADKLQEIFDRFVKLDNFVQGSGLGLSICKLIVHTLGGKLSVESQEGVGSTFSFTIPYNKELGVRSLELGIIPASGNEELRISNSKLKTQNRKAISPNSKLQTQHSGTILIAEDVKSNFMVVKEMIRGRYEVLWAHDGNEAVEIVKEKNPDLILMDIKMPQKNGLEATREIREFNPDVPIVALTANAFDEDRQMAQQAGMTNFLPKPVNRDTLEAILTAYL